MKRIAIGGALLLALAAACGDTAATVASAPTTLPLQTSATSTAVTTSATSTTALPTTLAPVASASEPPWGGPALARSEVPDTLAAQWNQSAVTGFCSALYSTTPLPAGAAIRSADYSGGWAVAWDMADGPGRFGSGEYCDDCGRGAFGLAGSTLRAGGSETDIWDRQLLWTDGSKAGYGFEGVGDGTQGEPLLMYLLIKDEGCLFNVWSFLGEDHLLGLVDGLRFVEGLRGEPTPWRSDQPPPQAVELGAPAWVSEPPLTTADISDLYILEWESEAGSPAACPLLAYADLQAPDATIRRAASAGEMLLAWDRPSGPGHDGASNPCDDCGRGAIGLGTFQGGQINDPITRTWSDGSEAATFFGFYGTEAFLRPQGFGCTYWLWSHLGADHLDYLFTQLRRVEGYP